MGVKASRFSEPPLTEQFSSQKNNEQVKTCKEHSSFDCFDCFPTIIKKTNHVRNKQEINHHLQICEGPMLANRFIMGKQISSGGSGVIHIAFDTKFKKKIAIKRLKKNAKLEKRRESELALNISNEVIRSHPLIVCPIEYIELNQNYKYIDEDGDETAPCLLIMELLGINKILFILGFFFFNIYFFFIYYIVSSFQF